jgi:hypothetical protein
MKGDRMATKDAAKDQGKGGVGIETALTGILAVLVDEREARIADKYQPRKTEVLLAEAGLSYGEIATLLNKDYNAVRMAVTRSRKS